MSKVWKVVISIVVAVVVIGAVGATGFIAGREWTLRTLAQRSGSVTQLPGSPANPNPNSGQNQGRNNLRPRGGFSWFFGPRGFWGHGFRSGRGRLFGLFFGPFFLIGGLIRGLMGLAFLALLFGLAVFVYRRWQPRPLSPVSAPVDVPPAPTVTPVDSAPGTDEIINKE